jgi:beta-alanine--pyruvate transaminase
MNAAQQPSQPLDLEHYWMPYTNNRDFKRSPRMIASAEGMYYTTVEGKKVLDGLATLWCVNAGHCRPKIVEAIRKQAGILDFSSSFSLGHPLPFEVARRIAELAPEGMEQVFFVNSGSEAVDTALKIALAYHRLKGEGTRTRFIGRERGYHGVNLAGISVGGVPANRKAYGVMLPGVDHLRHTHDPARSAFTRGAPIAGAEFADELEARIIPLHDASNIAAVIVEPVAGSTGVLIPPRGYLDRLRKICDRHGILLIFDEVITGFGRLGTPFAADYFGVRPDMITLAKALTNGAVPMGAVVVCKAIYDAFMTGPENAIELFHGYTYSGHPVAAAAGLATLDIYRREGLLTRAATLAPYWEDAVHALRGLPHVIDLRNIGLMAGIEFEPRPGKPGTRAYDAFVKAFEQGLLIRTTGDIIALSPPLTVEKSEIDRMFEILGDVLLNLA